jgi:hypothetical protein
MVYMQFVFKLKEQHYMLTCPPETPFKWACVRVANEAKIRKVETFTGAPVDTEMTAREVFLKHGKEIAIFVM